MVNQESASGIIDDFLMVMRAYLYRNEDKEWEIMVKMTLIMRDLMVGNLNLKSIRYSEEHKNWRLFGG